MHVHDQLSPYGAFSSLVELYLKVLLSAVTIRSEIYFETHFASVTNSLTYLLQYMASFAEPKPVVPYPAILLTLLLTVAQEAFNFKKISKQNCIFRLPMLFSKTRIGFFKMKEKKVLVSLFGYLLTRPFDSMAAEKTRSENVIGIK